MKKGVLERYKEYLPISDSTPIFTLGEGDTPLVKSRNIAKEVGCDELYFKLEGCNPSGSFKDRGMVVAVANALEQGSTTIVCASTGNTSASAAAYGAYCGLETIVLVPKGNVVTVEGVTCHTEDVDMSGYRLRDGKITVPDAPGFGMKLTRSGT